MNYPHNLYIHVPFCRSKCKYCAFYSVACEKPDWEKYCQNICDEIKFWANRLGKIEIPTVFFGGGTPSLMPVDVMARILQTVSDNFIVNKDCEITMESNPKTLNHEKLSDFVSMGINRLSVGVQSLNDDELKFLGRCHNAKEALDLLNIAQNMNIRVSADFIYGLPGHNVKSVVDLCNEINKLGLEHVSLYELTIEENTPFGKMNLDMPNNETMAQMYTEIPNVLNLPRYEVSNYAVPGQECRHNKNIWNGEPYIGIGKAAAGRVYMNGVWYEQKGNNELLEKIPNDMRAIEKIITGMRTVSGVRLDSDIKSQLNTDWILKHRDLVVMDENSLRATDAGMLILDDLIMEITK